LPNAPAAGEILRLNDPERIAERALLQKLAEYPR